MPAVAVVGHLLLRERVDERVAQARAELAAFDREARLGRDRRGEPNPADHRPGEHAPQHEQEHGHRDWIHGIAILRRGLQLHARLPSKAHRL